MSEKVVIVESKKVCIAGDGCACEICKVAMEKMWREFYQAWKKASEYYIEQGKSIKEAQIDASREVLRFIAMYSPIQPSKLIGGV